MSEMIIFVAFGLVLLFLLFGGGVGQQVAGTVKSDTATKKADLDASIMTYAKERDSLITMAQQPRYIEYVKPPNATIDDRWMAQNYQINDALPWKRLEDVTSESVHSYLMPDRPDIDNPKLAMDASGGLYAVY